MKIDARIVATRLDPDYFEVEYEYSVSALRDDDGQRDVFSMVMRDHIRMASTPVNLERFRIGRPLLLTID